MTSVQKTVVKEGPNQGRKFWACPNSEKARCGFFEWDDEESGKSGGGMSGGGSSQPRVGGGGSQSGECYKVRNSINHDRYVGTNDSDNSSAVRGDIGQAVRMYFLT